jgi:hypothetical protein
MSESLDRALFLVFYLGIVLISVSVGPVVLDVFVTVKTIHPSVSALEQIFDGFVGAIVGILFLAERSLLFWIGVGLSCCALIIRRVITGKSFD